METKSESFDQTKHRLLKDGKSWVNKSVPEFDWTPEEVKLQYNELVDKVVAANSGLTPQQAIEKIEAVEEKHDHRFFGIGYSADSNRRLVTERNRFAALEDLKLILEEEKTELEKLKSTFQKTVDEVVLKTGDDSDEVQRGIDSALLYGVAQDLLEAKAIMIEGPIVQGFGESQDYPIPNDTVKQFLRDAFGEKTLRKAKLGRVTKDNKYLIYRSYSDEHIHEGNDLLQRGIAQWDDGGMLIAEDKDHYLQAAMFLEKVNDPQKLRHLYKVRATAGNSHGFHKIQLRSFGVERSSDFDYLSDVGLDTEEDKLRAYILGTLAHEVAHRYEHQLDRGVFDEYRQIMQEEITPQRKKYVSDYVLRHEEVYGSTENLLFGEDFAEAVRVYTTNPNFLQKSYPRRFTFIQANFPFIKPGSVVEAVKNSHSR